MNALFCSMSNNFGISGFLYQSISLTSKVHSDVPFSRISQNKPNSVLEFELYSLVTHFITLVVTQNATNILYTCGSNFWPYTGFVVHVLYYAGISPIHQR